MLDFRFVDMIHTRMLVRYGSAWVAKWPAGTEEMVKADWADVLDGVTPDGIRHALEHLPPDFPPTATQFRSMCASLPRYVGPAIAEPKADPARAAEALAQLRTLKLARKPLDWAYELQEREKAGEVLTEAQRRTWRKALETAPVSFTAGEFNPIENYKLPPGMRADMGASNATHA